MKSCSVKWCSMKWCNCVVTKHATVGLLGLFRVTWKNTKVLLFMKDVLSYNQVPWSQSTKIKQSSFFPDTN